MTSARHEHPTLRVATWNIHKGVQGLGPVRRLEIHNIGHAVEQLDADIICLQEVRHTNRREALYFSHWPSQPQADFLAPAGYEAIYRTNAVTRHGEHGNAMLSRWPVLHHKHRDISDHRFEQRGFLHTELQITDRRVHVLVVHLGLVPASRVRQLALLLAHIEQDIPADAPVLVAGDFNDWGTGLGRRMAQAGFREWREQPTPTYPARLPLNQLDHVYARGLTPVRAMVPSGRIWPRMSDHLPLVAELAWND